MKIDAIHILPLPRTPSRPCRVGDPLPGDNLHTLVEIVSDQGVTGLGSVYTSGRLVQGSLEVLKRHLIGQPDTTKVGGLTEARAIGVSACEHGLRLVPHGWNTAVGLAVDLHLVASLPNGRWVEYLVPTPYIDELVADPFLLDANGLLRVPDAPGLGIPWNPEAILKYTGRSLTLS